MSNIVLELDTQLRTRANGRERNSALPDFFSIAPLKDLGVKNPPGGAEELFASNHPYSSTVLDDILGELFTPSENVLEFCGIVSFEETSKDDQLSGLKAVMRQDPSLVILINYQANKVDSSVTDYLQEIKATGHLIVNIET